ncbi:MAG: tripartite tricarboxylate transporter TctB family protein [Burkholderiaceae bacterium]
MKRIDRRDFAAGLALVAFGTFVALYASSHYQIGQASRMGPGYFPTALGWVLAGLGVIIMLFSFRKTVHALTPPPFAARPLVAVLVAVWVFAVLINRVGLIPTAFACVVIAALAGNTFKLKSALLLGVFLAVLSWLIFTFGLQMTLPAFTFQG